MTRALLISSVLLLLVWSGCDWTETSPVEAQVVVEAYLIAEGRLPEIRLTMTAPVTGVYDANEGGVAGATVMVHRLGGDDKPVETYAYQTPPRRGRYVPNDRATTIIPGARYMLDVTLANGERLSSITTVPDTFSILSLEPDSVVFEGTRAEMTLTRSRYPGRQAYIIMTTQAHEASLENATPITRRILEEDFDLSVEDLYITSSPAINEATYVDDEEGPLVIPIPWLAIRFYGMHQVRVSAVDDNLYDFLRSQLVQQGGSTFLPGEVPNILDHVEGGTGIFGSYAVDGALLVVFPEAD